MRRCTGIPPTSPPSPGPNGPRCWEKSSPGGRCPSSKIMKEHLKSYIEESKTEHVRGLRILLEYFYATEIFDEITKSGAKIISIFGSARTKPQSPEYRMAHELGALLYRAG